MTVSEIGDRLLAYAGLTRTDTTLPIGTASFLADAIGGAVSEMVRKARPLFDRPYGAVLPAQATDTITATSTNSNAITSATANFLKLCCTIRLPGAEADATIVTTTGTTAGTIAPGWAVASGTAHSAKMWGDALAMTCGILLDDNTKVSINGKELRRVANRATALKDVGTNGDGFGMECCGNEWPEVWWPERDQLGGSYVRVYPLPAVATEISVKGTQAIPEITSTNVLMSTETFGLEDHVARDIWLPLATQRWANCPLMANSTSREEIARQYGEAMNALGEVLPKRQPLPAWNSNPHRRRDGRHW